MERPGWYGICATDPFGVSQQRYELFFRHVPVPNPIEPPLPSLGVPCFTRYQMAKNVAVRHLEEAEMTGEHLQNVFRKVSFRNNSAPRNIAGVPGLNLRQEYRANTGPEAVRTDQKIG